MVDSFFTLYRKAGGYIHSIDLPETLPTTLQIAPTRLGGGGCLFGITRYLSESLTGSVLLTGRREIEAILSLISHCFPCIMIDGWSTSSGSLGLEKVKYAPWLPVQACRGSIRDSRAHCSTWNTGLYSQTKQVV
jgi:hypothetical protein